MTPDDLAKERFRERIDTIRALLTLTPNEMREMIERQPDETRKLPETLDPLAAALLELAQQCANASARVKWAIEQDTN